MTSSFPTLVPTSAPAAAVALAAPTALPVLVPPVGHSLVLLSGGLATRTVEVDLVELETAIAA